MGSGPTDDEVELFTCQLGRGVDGYIATETIDNLLGELEADFAVGLFATPINEGEAHFVACLEELACPVRLDVQVMLAYLEPGTDLFELVRLSVLLVLLLLLGLLVIVLTPVDYFGNRRFGVGANLH